MLSYRLLGAVDFSYNERPRLRMHGGGRKTVWWIVVAKLRSRSLVHRLGEQRAEAAYPLIFFAQHVKQCEQAVPAGVVAEAWIAPGDLEQLLHGALEIVLHDFA